LNFSDVMKAIPDGEHTQTISVSKGWMQGRTVYGGLTASIALEAVHKKFPDLPPIRSAQITFVGPAGESFEIQTSVLRRGKSVTSIRADVVGDNGIGVSCLFVFGKARESIFDESFIRMPSVPSPESCGKYYLPGAPLTPDFINHFDCRLARGKRPMSASKTHEHLVWIKHRDESAIGPCAMLAIADMSAPGLAAMMPKTGMISTMTWMVNFLHDELQTKDGWWLVGTKAENGKNGYSSENTAIWNSLGSCVATARQTVAIFL